MAARVALRPGRTWVALDATFDRFDDAVGAGRFLLTLEPRPRNLSIDDERLVSLLGLAGPGVSPGAATFPGAGVWGASGRNAANVVIADIG